MITDQDAAEGRYSVEVTMPDVHGQLMYGFPAPRTSVYVCLAYKQTENIANVLKHVRF